MPVLNTLKSSSDFKKVYAGKKFYTQAFSVHFVPEYKQHDLPLFGITVSKKTISKKAVDRNLVRRRLREITRLYLNIPELSGYGIVMTAIRETKIADWDIYVSSARYALKKLLE